MGAAAGWVRAEYRDLGLRSPNALRNLHSNTARERDGQGKRNQKENENKKIENRN
jgi:hypothetical protein